MSRTTQAILDLAVLTLGLWVAFFIRFDGHPPFQMFKHLIFMTPWVVGFEYSVFVFFGIHRFSWRFVGLRDVTRIFVALFCSSLILFILRLAAARLFTLSSYFQYVLIPMGVLAMNFVIIFIGISGVRALRRLSTEKRATKKRGKGVTTQEPTILIGAGAAGLQVAKELMARPELGMRPIGFLDDDKLKIGTVVHGIKVLGPTSKIKSVAQSHGATQALITIASVRGKDIRRLGRQCRDVGLKTKIIPTVHDLVGGHINIGGIRELVIEDLLRRAPVRLEKKEVSNFIEGQVILVSGAGGSIGSELCVQICQYKPQKLIMVERSENALFESHRELLAKFPKIELVPCIADVSDKKRLRSVLGEHSPSTIFHAAAHKHVPMMESNPGEAVKNNVFGTKALADMADEFKVEAFVMVSTDKAVNPTSVMGTTKRIAERYVRALNAESKTRFVTVRFGNVLGSAGSVIPIFKKQIAQGGPVTVTHPDMTRYFMTIPEASQLILQAGTMGKGGEIFILDMGDPVRIVDLAKDLIALSGLEEGLDIKIEFTGIRPGEKLYEELSSDKENTTLTRHPQIHVGQHVQVSLDALKQDLSKLLESTENGKVAIRQELVRLVPEYKCEVLMEMEDKKKTSESKDLLALGRSDTSSPYLEQHIPA